MFATAIHKLAPRSILCVFLGYSTHHKGYRCLDLSSNRVIISRHVIFDETAFPFAERYGPSIPVDLEFLTDITGVVPAPIGPSHKCLPVGTSPSTFYAACALAGHREAVPGAPFEDAEDPPAPALYIPPALRAVEPPSAPRAALELPDALRHGSAPPSSPTGSSAVPRGPPPGFPPPQPARYFTHVYERRPHHLPPPLLLLQQPRCPRVRLLSLQ